MDSLWKFIKKLVGFSSKQFTRTELHKMLSDHRKQVQKVARGGITVSSDKKLNGALDFFARVKNSSWKRGQFGDTVQASSGEAGYGIYAYPANSKSMEKYYTANGENIFSIDAKPNAVIINLSDEFNRLKEYANSEFEKTKKEMSYYNPPKFTKNGIQRFPYIIRGYLNKYYPEADAFIVPHNGFGIPSSEQLVIINENAFDFTNETDPEVLFRFRSRDPEVNKVLDEMDEYRKTGVLGPTLRPPIPPKPPVKKTETPEPENKGGKTVDKTIVTKRTYEGDFVDAIDRELEKKGLTRETQNQKEAEQIGLTIIEMEGLEGALNRVRSGEIGGAPAGAIWHEKLKDIDSKMNAETNPEMYNLLAKEYADITEEMGNVATLAGQFSAFFNYIYNTSDLGFNAERLIRDYKLVNNGEISPEMEEKFRKLAKDFKEVQEKLASEQLKVKELEEQAAVDAIRNSIERQNRKKAKASDKIREKTDKLVALIDAGKLNRPGIFTAASPGSLAWDLALETVRTAVKATGRTLEAIAKGFEAIKTTDWYKNLDANKQKQAKNAYFDYFTEVDDKKEIGRAHV